MTHELAFGLSGPAGGRKRLAAAGLVPALVWTAVVFALQVALYSAWFAHRAAAEALPGDGTMWSLAVLILVSPLFDAAVFGGLFLVQFPVLRRSGRLAVSLPLLVCLNALAIAGGALALVGSGCHVSLTIAALPTMLAASVGAWRHESWLRQVQR